MPLPPMSAGDMFSPLEKADTAADREKPDGTGGALGLVLMGPPEKRGMRNGGIGMKKRRSRHVHWTEKGRRPMVGADAEADRR